MTRRKLVAGNWKMNGDRAALAELDGIAAAAAAHRGVDVALCPPFTLIAPAAERAQGVAIGGQDCHAAAQGAHTGCVSAAMLAEAGAELVIVGHSERRQDQQESDALVRAKAEAAIAAGLIAIVCVGETEGDAGRAVAVVEAQIAGSVPAGGSAAMLVIAYEPVWAIGTGRTPSLDEVTEMHGAIRASLGTLLGDAGAAVRILYGGSVKPDNAAALMALPDVDGALVGGASLTADLFEPIISAAAQGLAEPS